MTVSDLLTFMKSELGSKDNKLVENALNELSKHMKSRECFSPEKFKKWFIDKNVVFMGNPLGFLVKCGSADIDKGLFDKEKITLSLRPLCELLQANDFKDNAGALNFVRYAEEYIINHDLMSIEELSDWNNKVVSYLMEHDLKTVKDFALMFEKSKTMKNLKLPIQEFKKEANEDMKQWLTLMDDLGCIGKTEKEETDLPFELGEESEKL